jgi:hypothetical protein
MARAAEDREIILQMVGAGIMVKLCGIRVEGGKWKFFLDKDEGTMADFLDEEDADLLPKLRTKSEYVYTWGKALDLLRRYPLFLHGHQHLTQETGGGDTSDRSSWAEEIGDRPLYQ